MNSERERNRDETSLRTLRPQHGLKRHTGTTGRAPDRVPGTSHKRLHYPTDWLSIDSSTGPVEGCEERCPLLEKDHRHVLDPVRDPDLVRSLGSR